MLLKIRKWWCMLLTAVIVFCTMYMITNVRIYLEPTQQVTLQDQKFQLVPKNWRGLSDKQISGLSVLGRRLFLEDESIPPRTDRNFTILPWENAAYLEKRYIYRYHYELKPHDPFENCSVRNCRITNNRSELWDADAVLSCLFRTHGNSSIPPKRGKPSQRWVFLSDESPFRTFLYRGNDMRNYNGLFNWSMTYRMDSDVPVPYGRTLPLRKNDNIDETPRNKSKLVAIMISNCAGENRRMYYLKELRKHLDIDIYGKCGNLDCSGHYGEDCPKLNDYMFYLAFENVDCKQYISEKVWWNAYNKGAIPVILGASLEECASFLPPKSYIHVRNFSSPADLAKYLVHLNETPSEYESFFSWRTQYKVVEEHGFFLAPNYHYCRLCEALNYNDPSPKVYNNLDNFWDKKKDCMKPVI